MSRVVIVGGGFGGFYLDTFLENHEEQISEIKETSALMIL